ncbi:MAG: PAS domain S-box protein [Dehalococcoidales bacterium]|nr:PAS domain S-box protein [Dehalococcoidales bacterium]
MKVLIVEDNEDGRKLLVKQLRAYGHKVTAAADGAEALEQALRETPDILVTDILMPRMDGYQLCYEWRQNDRLRDIPFVFYTATYTSDEDEEFALSLGANTFIRKPAEPDAFVQILSQVFERTKAGLLPPPEVVLPEPSLYLTEYNRRLVTKLNEKVAQLEVEIAERKRVEEEIGHLNAVLHAIRGINQLIVQEKDRERLLQGVCGNLIKTRGYYNAWLVLLDDSGRLLTYAEAGLGKDFLPMVKRLKRGELTSCGQKALTQAEVVVNEDPLSTCGDCPLATRYSGRGAMSTRLERSGRVYGLLSASVPLEFIKGEEEQSLFQEVAEDITFALHDMELEEKRKRVEEMLKQSEENLRAYLESAPDGVYISDLKGTFLYGNKKAEELTGYEREELMGKSFLKLKLLPAKHLAKASRLLALNAMGRPTGPDEFELIRKDGSRMWVEITTTPIKQRGKVVVIGFVRDITERKRMEEQLIIADRLASVGELASGIAHELNNPLTGVIGFTQMVLDKDIPDDIKEDIQVVYSEAQRAAQVVKNLLTFARKHAPEKQLMSINSIIEKVLELRAYEQRVNNIQVNAQFAPDLPEVMADYFQLQQVFLNIIINAEHFMIEAHNGGNLTITTERAEDAIKASFADDGPGIAEENLGYLFDPFFTTKEVGSGTGLGLSICHGIVAKHGGRIYAESELGKGATFIVELPIGADDREGGRNEKL